MEKKLFIYFFMSGLLFCSCRQSVERGEAGNYLIQEVKQENRTFTTAYSARLQGQQVVEIRPQVSGTITRICIEEGQAVHRGEVLFVIDQIPYQASLAEAVANVKTAEASLATARLNLESTEILRQKEVVQDYALKEARHALAAAEGTWEQACAQEVNARNNLSYTEVKSPVDGVAGMIAYRTGALVSPSITEPLVTVSDDSRMHAYFSLTEARLIDLLEQYGSLQELVAQMPEVELCMANGSTYREKGHVAAVSGIVSTGTGSVMLRADFPNPQHLLRDGGSCTVILPTVREHCIVIPQAATYELQNRVFVYKVVDGKAQSTPVTLFRINNGTEYIVESGLQEGDRIIAEGAGLVKEGVSVDLQQATQTNERK